MHSQALVEPPFLPWGWTLSISAWNYPPWVMHADARQWVPGKLAHATTRYEDICGLNIIKYSTNYNHQRRNNYFSDKEATENFVFNSRLSWKFKREPSLNVDQSVPESKIFWKGQIHFKMSCLKFSGLQRSLAEGKNHGVTKIGTNWETNTCLNFYWNYRN